LANSHDFGELLARQRRASGVGGRSQQQPVELLLRIRRFDLERGYETDFTAESGFLGQP